MTNTPERSAARPSAEPGTAIHFGPFVLDAGAFSLRRDGQLVKLERRPMELLLLLAASSGRLVTRDQIVERLWGSQIHVEIDMGIHTAIRKLRRALGDSRGCIETVAGKGYRFMPSLCPSGNSHLPSDPASARSRRVIAVLPFDILSPSASDAYIADGLTDETIASLGRIDPDRLAVIGRMSAIAARSMAWPLDAIGRELGADYIVEGSVRIENERLRVTCKLIDAADQRQIWAQSLDAEPSSLLAFQRELATTIAAQIHLQLDEGRTDVLRRRQTDNPAAYDQFLRGRHLLYQHTAATNKRALECFQQATACDPSYALAWAGTSETLACSPINSDLPAGAIAAPARAAAARALAADPDLAEAQTAMGFVQFWLDWDWKEAERSFRRATETDPNYPAAHRMLGIALSHLGHHVEAHEAFTQARILDPFHALIHALSAFVAFQARDYSTALGHARHAIVVDPNFWIGRFQLAQILAETGEVGQAIEILEKMCRFPSCNSKVLALQGYLLAVSGKTEAARSRLADLAERARAGFVPPYACALIHLGLNDAEAALAALRTALEVRDVNLVFLPHDPKWDRLRSDPRFAELIAQCAFEKTNSRPVRLRAVNG
ncbi:MAG TPA: winged helix-turn-helix domain-containing protein [Rhizomicrobium sp.]|jgi:TolB-like protein/Flp pilus assembly protein TadD|nr:winged helix-turn-helix domain-containing protein [Rhizomicrobium sp.]